MPGRRIDEEESGRICAEFSVQFEAYEEGALSVIARTAVMVALGWSRSSTKMESLLYKSKAFFSAKMGTVFEPVTYMRKGKLCHREGRGFYEFACRWLGAREVAPPPRTGALRAREPPPRTGALRAREVAPPPRPGALSSRELVPPPRSGAPVAAPPPAPPAVPPPLAAPATVPLAAPPPARPACASAPLRVASFSVPVALAHDGGRSPLSSMPPSDASGVFRGVPALLPWGGSLCSGCDDDSQSPSQASVCGASAPAPAPAASVLSELHGDGGFLGGGASLGGENWDNDSIAVDGADGDSEDDAGPIKRARVEGK
jgi:hypothetical protein